MYADGAAFIAAIYGLVSIQVAIARSHKVAAHKGHASASSPGPRTPASPLSPLRKLL